LLLSLAQLHFLSFSPPPPLSHTHQQPPIHIIYIWL